MPVFAASTVLVIAPHPDDEVLGCGGSILHHIEAGRIVHVLYLTYGERGSPHYSPEELRTVREMEAVNAARVLGIGVSELHFAWFPDGSIQPADLDQVGVVVRLLREVHPGLVYLPHAGDGSFDHRAGFELGWRAIGIAGSRNFPEWGTDPHWVPTVLGYEVWAAIGQPVYFEDITAMLDRKLTALACYASQTADAKGPGQASHIGPAGTATTSEPHNAQHSPLTRHANTARSLTQCLSPSRQSTISIPGRRGTATALGTGRRSPQRSNRPGAR